MVESGPYIDFRMKDLQDGPREASFIGEDGAARSYDGTNSWSSSDPLGTAVILGPSGGPKIASRH